MSDTTTLTARINLEYDVQILSVTDDSRVVDRYRAGRGLLDAIAVNLTNGNGDFQSKYHYHKEHTIANAGSVTLDLSALTDDRGRAITFAAITVMLIRVQSPAAGITLTVGNAATNIWSAWTSSSTATEPVSSILLRTNEVDGWTVDSTHKNLKLANGSGASITADVSLIGF